MSEMQEIYDHIEAHLDESMAILADLVRQPSVSAQDMGFDKAPGVVKDALDSVGLNAEIVPVPNDGHPSVFGSMSGEGENTLLFYTHYDVQPPEPLELWDSEPFEPTRRDGRIYGRGTSDDKGNIVARLAAIRAFNEVRGGLPCNLKFFVEGEEEIGSRNLRGLIDTRGQEFVADACIWEGGGRNLSNDPFIYLGLKGVLTIQMSVKLLHGDAHSSYAPILPSASWRLLQALNSIKDPSDDRCLIPGFYDAIRPATDAEDAAVAALPDEAPEWKEVFGVESFVGGIGGEDLRRKLLFEPSANINGFESGYNGAGMKTVLPAEATAKMDFRLVPDMRPEDIFEKLRTHLDRQGFEDVELEYLAGVNPARTPIESPWVALVAETAEEIYDRKPVIAPTMAGTGPMYEFAEILGMPIATSGVDHPSHKIHAPNENITEEDFLLGAKHAALIMQRFGERGLGG
ncbi:MAG: M20/M25/M40 family metallo-hydrolase [Chloroflexi bacterium]|jgi:acetylornithine deacetylase/succinyl-diaminopimelate desuccinylase-like protein|nr:M20/M25/M40 family metallo-hydrolase [Chloroflexota bacterium]MBT4073527.1 M20/M25/M40 family metallo-hydrolase [Chloroflexota bacterium]MBT4513856.1 M20/M25/M40 family metallo-hydrolase [Chloroflexota bacterium]MBT5318842.1 M20/M25/M40 family metallo-hydrolase [Chloroflexota bacterium]MBT6681390.1 M20/M25/M40 family metallo-hydrolase [Chloroflexota bacterium]